MSTADYQDQASSRAWQFESATDLIAGRGMIVAEYFDVGCPLRGILIIAYLPYASISGRSVRHMWRRKWVMACSTAVLTVGSWS